MKSQVLGMGHIKSFLILRATKVQNLKLHYRIQGLLRTEFSNSKGVSKFFFHLRAIFS